MDLIAHINLKAPQAVQSCEEHRIRGQLDYYSFKGIEFDPFEKIGRNVLIA